jgi:hypothetical protein
MQDTYALNFNQTGKFLFTFIASIFTGCICVAFLAYYFRDIQEWQLLTIIYSGLALVIGGTLFIALKKILVIADVSILNDGLEIRFRKHSVFYAEDFCIRWENIISAKAYFESDNNTYYYHFKSINPTRNFSLSYPKGMNEVSDTEFWLHLKDSLSGNPKDRN